MRIIKPGELARAAVGTNPLAPDEIFFVELWYSMTHQKSLDSYRVRCMNSRMIVRELADELAIGIISPNEVVSLCAEASDCLNNDPVVKALFTHYMKVIQPFLNDPPHGVEQKNRNKEKCREFVFIMNDFRAAMTKSYWEGLCSALVQTLISGKKDELKTVVSHTISDLIDRGWPTESIFTWHHHFLAEESRSNYTFQENFSFMLRFFSQTPQEFEVTLRLKGSSNLLPLEEYGPFKFVDPKTANLGEGASKKFTTGGAFSCLARATVHESDFLSAAIKAKETFEQFIDLLRFDYEPYLLQIDSRCHVKRLSDGKVELPVVRATVLNPASPSDHANFASFAAGVKTLSYRSNTEENSLRKIRGAIRQYRFGRDSENYKDKFLNWWMGLEGVANVSTGNIGDNVTNNVSKVMVLPYLSRLLSDALGTMRFVSIEWHPDLRNYCNGRVLATISPEDLFQIIHSPKEREILLAACAKSPTLHYRCQLLFESFADPVKTLAKIDAHLRHLQWQLARLYRIRCCIVHGSDVRFRLALFAANLEFYLKETIKFLISKLNSNDHIYNLDEIFSRALVAFNRLVMELKSPGAGAEEIRQAVFSNIVV